MPNGKCPFYLGEPCSSSNKAYCFSLCPDCDGEGSLNGRPLEEIRKEAYAYTSSRKKLPEDYRDSDNPRRMHNPRDARWTQEDHDMTYFPTFGGLVRR
jgi:hypothetical protein